ncbi:MAG: pyridoxal phosphate-dependent aminotransferase [Pseudomonadota bacterium]
MDAEHITSFTRGERVASIEISEIVQISEAAARKRAAGEPVITLGTGEPDFDTPDHVKQAAVDAIWAGDTKYPATRGNPPLVDAILAKFSRENGLTFERDQIIVSAGAKQILFNAQMASLSAGDEVIVPAPYWTTYLDMVTVCGGRPHVVTCSAENGFKLTPEQLEAAINANTRWLLLNTPGNPSGAVYSVAEMRALGAVLERHKRVWLMVDEIYEHIVYGADGFTSALQTLPQLADRMLIVNGVSKAYAMTGWRLGYGAGPAPLIKAMAVVQGQATSGACSISQAAATAALNGNQDFLTERCASFRDRRDMMVAALNQSSGLSCQMPEGAFYLYPSCQGVLGLKTPAGDVLASDADFCAYLLDAHGVAVVPGRAFGLPGHFRLSYAYSKELLESAAASIRAACGALR